MTSELYYIPEGEFDKVVNEKILEADEVIISVSFVFLSGLSLLYDNLKKACSKSKLTIITSNYLKSSEPNALEKLLELKKSGANVYFYDSFANDQSFHMKSFLFSKK